MASEDLGRGRSSLEVAWEIGRRDVRANRRVSVVMLVRHLVQPLIQAGLFWFLLAGILRLDFSRSVTVYPPFLLAGLVAWSFVSTVVGGSALCLSSNAGLVRRVAFPREALVYSVAVQGFVQLAVTTVALAGVVVAVPGSSSLGIAVQLWLIPVFAVLGLLSIGIGLIVAVLSAILPDTALAIPMVLQVLVLRHAHRLSSGRNGAEVAGRQFPLESTGSDR